MDKKYIDMLESIGTMTVQISIDYSTYTHKFYLNTNLNTVNGEYITTICEHKDTPEETIEATYNKMINANEGLYTVNKSTRQEKIFKWNGKKFIKTLDRKVPNNIIIED